ncbi:aminotransferase class V-fold PLP-dependent enzyme [Melissospora conviva]|uniref:aminotransferase class V-fold PLP-dependent enzyme n=1 Tax=Melissospora conviva TaxID=3388432 RepID=UPI003B792A5E
MTVAPFNARRAIAPTFVLPAVLGSDVMVPLANGAMVSFANFDHAATAPCLSAVAEEIVDFLPWYASAHRGAGTLSNMCTARYEDARQAVRQFVGARPDDAVIFTRNTTDAFNLLARSVPDDATVIVFAGEHHANLLPWRTVEHLPIPPGIDELLADLERTLARRRGGEVLVSVTAASNVTGELLPLQEIVETAHRYGARVAVDAAQLVAHRPLDMAGLDADYVAFSGHKMYAPFGVGVLAGRADWLASAEPYLIGGGATAYVSDDADRVEWVSGEARHEAGTPNVIGAVALATACRVLRPAWDSIMAYESALLTRLRTGLAEIPGVGELSLFGPASSRVGIVTMSLDGIDSGLLASALSVEYGIGVRQGWFCAHPLTRHLLRDRHPDASSGTAVRASLGLGVTLEQVDRLLDAVQTISDIGPQLVYAGGEGIWRPQPEPTPATLQALRQRG